MLPSLSITRLLAQSPAEPFERPSDLILGGIFLGSLLLVEPLEGFDEHTSRQFSKDISERNTALRRTARALGTTAVDVALTGATYLLGKATGDSKLQRVGLRTLESVLETVAVTKVFKIAVGRARPEVSGHSDVFRPLTFDSEYHSFPSGHASNVFALATTLTLELGDDAKWIPFVAYPIATVTAVSRVQDRRHWVTDVVAGAALGIFTSSVLWRPPHSPSDASGVSFRIFTPTDEFVGLGLTIPLR
ncbi:MAG: phosphatase PAP2 family protein [Gemmatimonadota bacterium]